MKDFGMIMELSRWLQEDAQYTPALKSHNSVVAIRTVVKHIVASKNIYHVMQRQESNRAMMATLNYNLRGAHELMQHWIALDSMGTPTPIKLQLHMQDMSDTLIETWSKMAGSTSSSIGTPISDAQAHNVVKVKLPPGDIPAVFSRSIVPPTITAPPTGLLADIPPYSSLISFNGVSTTTWTLSDLASLVNATRGEERELAFRLPAAPVHDIPEPPPPVDPESIESPSKPEPSDMNVINDSKNDKEDHDNNGADNKDEAGDGSGGDEKDGEDTSEVEGQDEDGVSVSVTPSRVPVGEATTPATTDDRSTNDKKADDSTNESASPPADVPTEAPQTPTPTFTTPTTPVSKYGDGDDATLSNDSGAPTSGTDIKKSSSMLRSASKRLRRAMSKRNPSAATTTIAQQASSYRFYVTVEQIDGLPKKWSEITVEHTDQTDPVLLQVMDGRADWNQTVTFLRSYSAWDDKAANVRFQVKWRGRRVCRLNLNMEQLRLDMGDTPGPVAKTAHVAGVGGLMVKMDFLFNFVLVNDDAAASIDAEPTVPEGEEPTDLVTVTIPPGSLCASFSVTDVPPRLMRFVALPDRSRGPLEGKVVPGSELVEFNGMDTLAWGLSDLKMAMARAEGDRTLVFQPPSSNLESKSQLSTDYDGPSGPDPAAAAAAAPTPEQQPGTTAPTGATPLVDEADAVEESDAPDPADLVEHSVARTFWQQNFGERVVVEWQTFAEAMMESDITSDSTADPANILSHHLDHQFTGSVHCLDYNRLTKNLGLFGIMELIRSQHDNHNWATSGVIPPDANSDLTDRTIVVSGGVDVSTVTTLSNGVPQSYSMLNRCLSQLGDIHRVCPGPDPSTMVVEFVLPVDAARVAQCREGLILPREVIIKGRPMIDLGFPTALTVDLAAAMRARRGIPQIRASNNTLAVLRLAAGKESMRRDEDSIGGQIETLKRWLQDTLNNHALKSSKSPNTASSKEKAKMDERNIIRVFKDHITKATAEFEERQEQQQLSLIDVESKLDKVVVEKITLAFEKLHDDKVKSLSNVDTSNEQIGWAQALLDSAGSIYEDVEQYGWYATMADLTLSQGDERSSRKREAAVDTFIKNLRTLPTDDDKHDSLEAESFHLRLLCDEVEKIVRMFEGRGGKCDALVVLRPTIIDLEGWDNLLVVTIPDQQLRDDINQLVSQEPVSLHNASQSTSRTSVAIP